MRRAALVLPVQDLGPKPADQLEIAVELSWAEIPARCAFPSSSLLLSRRGGSVAGPWADPC